MSTIWDSIGDSMRGLAPTLVEGVGGALFSSVIPGAGVLLAPVLHEAVQRSLGIPTDKTKPISDEDAARLVQDSQEYLRLRAELLTLEVQAQQAEQAALTERLKADDQSDSRLARNVRPLSLLYMLLVMTAAGVANAVGVKLDESYIDLGRTLLLTMVGFYFGGRTIEKLTQTVTGVTKDALTKPRR